MGIDEVSFGIILAMTTPKDAHPPGLAGAHPRIVPARKAGSESFSAAGVPIGFQLSDFWGWNTSDFVDNTTRGRLAEFVVATALGIQVNGVRDSWAPWDLTMSEPTPIRVEVKSASYVQSWFQKGYSPISFRTRKTLAWDAETNVSETVARRQADVYVFALLAHKDLATLNALEVDQWTFYVLPTSELDSRTRSQHSITLKSLEAMTPCLHYASLADAVRVAHHRSDSNER